jgi:hypothetical protein
MELDYSDGGFLEQIDYDDFEFEYDNLLMDSVSDNELTNLLNLCIRPVIYQAFKPLLPILVSSLLLKLVAYKTSATIIQLSTLNLLASSAIFAYLYEVKLLAFLTGIVTITYGLLALNLPSNRRRLVVVLFSLAHLFFGKIYLLKVQEWNSIKGNVCKLLRSPRKSMV